MALLATVRTGFKALPLIGTGDRRLHLAAAYGTGLQGRFPRSVLLVFGSQVFPGFLRTLAVFAALWTLWRKRSSLSMIRTWAKGRVKVFLVRRLTPYVVPIRSRLTPRAGRNSDANMVSIGFSFGVGRVSTRNTPEKARTAVRTNRDPVTQGDRERGFLGVLEGHTGRQACREQ